MWLNSSATIGFLLICFVLTKLIYFPMCCEGQNATHLSVDESHTTTPVPTSSAWKSLGTLVCMCQLAWTCHEGGTPGWMFPPLPIDEA